LAAFELESDPIVKKISTDVMEDVDKSHVE
jgi:hypothetical protein